MRAERPLSRRIEDHHHHLIEVSDSAEPKPIRDLYPSRLLVSSPPWTTRSCIAIEVVVLNDDVNAIVSGEEGRPTEEFPYECCARPVGSRDEPG